MDRSHDIERFEKPAFEPSELVDYGDARLTESGVSGSSDANNGYDS